MPSSNLEREPGWWDPTHTRARPIVSQSELSIMTFHPSVMYHPLTWIMHGLWPILQPKCFGFTFGGLTCHPSLHLYSFSSFQSFGVNFCWSLNSSYLQIPANFTDVCDHIWQPTGKTPSAVPALLPFLFVVKKSFWMRKNILNPMNH